MAFKPYNNLDLAALSRKLSRDKGNGFVIQEKKDLDDSIIDVNKWEEYDTYWHYNSEQGKPDWLRIRMGYGTGTGISAAIGESPFKTMYQYALELLGIQAPTFTVKQMEVMRAGSEAEGRVREKYKTLTGKNIIELGFCISKIDPRLGVSVDGVIEDDEGIIEIKAPQTMYRDLKENGKIFPSHYDQMMLGMFILNKRYCDYIVNALDTDEMIVTRVEFDSEYWENYIKPKLHYFFDEYLPELVRNEGLIYQDLRIRPPS